MKILFLDIDGVMNNHALLLRCGVHSIGDEFLDRLKRIVAATGAQIVLSSTWRKHEEDRQMVREALATRGMEFIGCTPVIWHKLTGSVPRAEEILTWMVGQDVTRFAVIDDDCDAGLGIEEHYFETDFEVGLTDEVAERVIAHLNTPGQSVWRQLDAVEVEELLS